MEINITTILTGIIVLLVIYLLNYMDKKNQRSIQRLGYIKDYIFPLKISNSIKEKYPHLSNKDIDEVLLGLQDYFYIASQANNKSLAMPSQVVDLAWHEFILFTHDYEVFCKKAFGQFYHHVPAEAMKSKTKAQKGIKLAWHLACKKETISVSKPNRLPRIFAIDTVLKIQNGFKYTLNCENTSSSISVSSYCASHISHSGSNSTSSCSGSSCSSGCGGGD
jgi:hypothetical protein